MKKYFYLIALVVIVISAGCSKQKEPAPVAAVPIEGYWFGFYKINGFTTNYNTALLIRPGGTFRFYELGIKTDTIALPAELKLEGTWTFSENVFKFGLPIGPRYATGSLARNANHTKLEGAYSIDGDIKGIMEYQK
jgi:hypothetical protein